MPLEYRIEICSPDSKGGESCCVMDSDKPFASIQRGDIINPKTWNSHWSKIYKSDSKFKHGMVLRATGFEHQIIQGDDGKIAKHIIGVFTEPLDDLEENRP